MILCQNGEESATFSAHVPENLKTPSPAFTALTIKYLQKAETQGRRTGCVDRLFV